MHRELSCMITLPWDDMGLDQSSINMGERVYEEAMRDMAQESPFSELVDYSFKSSILGYFFEVIRGLSKDPMKIAQYSMFMEVRMSEQGRIFCLSVGEEVADIL